MITMTNFKPTGIFEDFERGNQQTILGVTEAMNHYAKLGYISFIPLPDAQCDIDFIAYHPITHDLIKVQAKTSAYVRNGKHIIPLKSGGAGKGNRSVAKDYDELFALNSAGETQVIPYKDIADRSTQVTMK